MNEQIKKLAEQAGGFVDINKHVGGNNGCVVYTYDGLQAFAELVVKECLKECWYDMTPLEISNAIRAKFGMELVGE